MNFHRMSCVALLLPWGIFGDAHAQAAEQCGTGDTACYDRRYTDACGAPPRATHASCAAFFSSVESSPNRDDRAARFALAWAHNALGRHHGSGDLEEMTNHRAAALAIYRQLAAEDTSDPEALKGLAANTDDRPERVEALREALRMAPNPAPLALLTSELTRSGRSEDLIEAAEANDVMYELSRFPRKLDVASTVIGFYMRAGAEDRAEEVRQRARRDSGADGMLDELLRNALADPERTITALEILCYPAMVSAIEIGLCLRGVDAVFEALPETGGQESIQRVVDFSASRISRLVSDAQPALTSIDPGWRNRFVRELDALEERGYASLSVYGLRSYLEPDPAHRVEILERGLRIAPEHPWIYERLAMEYQEQQRWDDAIGIMRRALDLPTATSESRQRIERNIRSMEEARDRARP